eukprot:268778-Chlamydomonas_euryale.AAC.1
MPHATLRITLLASRRPTRHAHRAAAEQRVGRNNESPAGHAVPNGPHAGVRHAAYLCLRWQGAGAQAGDAWSAQGPQGRRNRVTRGRKGTSRGHACARLNAGHALACSALCAYLEWS